MAVEMSLAIPPGNQRVPEATLGPLSEPSGVGPVYPAKSLEATSSDRQHRGARSLKQSSERKAFRDSLSEGRDAPDGRQEKSVVFLRPFPPDMGAEHRCFGPTGLCRPFSHAEKCANGKSDRPFGKNNAEDLEENVSGGIRHACGPV